MPIKLNELIKVLSICPGKVHLNYTVISTVHNHVCEVHLWNFFFGKRCETRKHNTHLGLHTYLLAMKEAVISNNTLLSG